MEEAAALKKKWETETTYIAAIGGDSDMGSICIIGGGGPTGWEFFTNFDAHDKASIKGTADFFNDTQRWMNEKRLGVDMGHWNQDSGRRTVTGFTQEEHDAMYVEAAPAARHGLPVQGAGGDQPEAPVRQLLPDTYSGQAGGLIPGGAGAGLAPSRTGGPDDRALLSFLWNRKAARPGSRCGPPGFHPPSGHFMRRE